MQTPVLNLTRLSPVLTTSEIGRLAVIDILEASLAGNGAVGIRLAVRVTITSITARRGGSAMV
jgi:hypothetical protein